MYNNTRNKRKWQKLKKIREWAHMSAKSVSLSYSFFLFSYKIDSIVYNVVHTFFYSSMQFWSFLSRSWLAWAPKYRKENQHEREWMNEKKSNEWDRWTHIYLYIESMWLRLNKRVRVKNEEWKKNYTVNLWIVCMFACFCL